VVVLLAYLIDWRDGKSLKWVYKWHEIVYIEHMKSNVTKVFVYTYGAVVMIVAATLLIWTWVELAPIIGHLFGSVIGCFAAYFWLSIIGYKMDNWL